MLCCNSRGEVSVLGSRQGGRCVFVVVSGVCECAAVQQTDIVCCVLHAFCFICVSIFISSTTVVERHRSGAVTYRSTILQHSPANAARSQLECRNILVIVAHLLTPPAEAVLPGCTFGIYPTHTTTRKQQVSDELMPAVML